jgi:ligand-binding SRPBCC domain-containing protein
MTTQTQHRQKPGKPFHRFTSEQWLPYRVETVFAFFSNPENLPRLMPKRMDARIEEMDLRAPATLPPASDGLAGLAPGTHRSVAAGDGTTLRMSFRPVPFLPFRQKWDAAILDFAWNEGFCDVQTRGPFFFWKHCHRLCAEADPQTLASGTRLHDAVEFGLPLEPIGNLALPLVRAQLRSTFAYRHRRTLELLAAMTLR